MTTDEIVEYYSDLLITQYASLPKAVATVQAYIASLVQDQIIAQVGDAFDISDARGDQLDKLASYRGIHRNVFGLVPGTFWAMIPVADPAPDSYKGWPSVADPTPTWFWMKVSDSSSFEFESSMNDQQLRRVLNLKISLDSKPLTLSAIDNILYDAFGAYVNLVDNGDMTITYQHQSSDPDPDGLWNIVVLAGILPHPCGVSYNVVSV